MSARDAGTDASYHLTHLIPLLLICLVVFKKKTLRPLGCDASPMSYTDGPRRRARPSTGRLNPVFGRRLAEHVGSGVDRILGERRWDGHVWTALGSISTQNPEYLFYTWDPGAKRDSSEGPEGGFGVFFHGSCWESIFQRMSVSSSSVGTSQKAPPKAEIPAQSQLEDTVRFLDKSRQRMLTH